MDPLVEGWKYEGGAERVRGLNGLPVADFEGFVGA